MDRDRASLIAARAIAVLVPAAFLALFFAYPLATILTRGLTDGGLPTDVLGSEATLRVLWFTVWQAAATR